MKISIFHYDFDYVWLTAEILTEGNQLSFFHHTYTTLFREPEDFFEEYLI